MNEIYEKLVTKDQKGNVIKKEFSDGSWKEYTYDDKNNLLNYKFYKVSLISQCSSTYDDNGNKLTHQDQDGYWEKSTYNDNNKLLLYENSEGYWKKQTWDKFGNRLTSLDSTGYWDENEYNLFGNQISHTDSEGVYEEYFYDQSENFIVFINKKGQFYASDYKKHGIFSTFNHKTIYEPTKVLNDENQPIYCPLFLKLEGACAFIMVDRKGQKKEETVKEWKTLMKINGIELEEDEMLLAKDYDKFLKIMEQNGWKKEFIAFGP